LTFCTGALSWWGPSFVEYAIKYREEQGLPIDVEVDESAFFYNYIHT
jgi:hypothetical protein